MLGAILLEYHVPRCNQICKKVSTDVKSAKEDYTKQNTILGVIIANNPMDLVCIDFTKADPSKDGKENILVLTDAFTKFSQAFATPIQKAITITKILVDKWFYVYGIPACIHSNKGHIFDNEILSHLYAMYRSWAIHHHALQSTWKWSHWKIKLYINWPAQIIT